jgi:hypothetical protein
MSNSVSEQRSTLAAFLAAFPAIALLTSYLWLSLVTVVWAVVSGTFHGSFVAAAIFAVLLVPCGVFLTVRLIRTAIESERTLDL